MFQPGIVAQDSTVRIPLPTRAGDGGAEAFSATLEEADFDVHVNGSSTPLTLDASTFTINESVGSVAGKNYVLLDLSNDADLSGNAEAGSQVDVWLTPNDETLDSQTVAECIASFFIETDAEKGIRLAKELYASYTVGATGNTTSAMHASFLPASLGDDEVIGEVWAWYDVSEADWLLVRVTDYTASGQVAAVALLNGAVLPAGGPASGDYCFRFGVGMSSLLAATQASIDAIEADTTILTSGIISGFTAVTGTLSTTVCTTDITGYANDELIGRVIVFTGGTAAGQAAAITDYASASGTVTFSGGVTTAPVNLDPFVIV